MFYKEDRWVKVWHYHAELFYFIGEGEEYVSAGTGLPAHCTDVPPPKARKYTAACFLNGVWVLVDDYRGVVLYRKADGLRFQTNQLGALPDEFTLRKPRYANSVWENGRWVKNREAVLAEKLTLIAEELKRSDIVLQGLRIHQRHNPKPATLATIEAWELYQYKLILLQHAPKSGMRLPPPPATLT